MVPYHSSFLLNQPVSVCVLLLRLFLLPLLFGCGCLNGNTILNDGE